MMQGTWSGLASWLVLLGSLGLVAGLVFVAWWSLFSDRPRGRRRCPRCWYDLSWSSGMRCNECGHEAKSEGQLLRTRRRWILGITSIVGCTVVGVLGIDRATSVGWMSYVPTSALFLLINVADDPSGPVMAEIDRRVRGGKLTDEEWITLLERCAAGDPGTRPPTDDWATKYGPLLAMARHRIGRSPDTAWAIEAGAILWDIPPHLALTSRSVWPVGTAPIVDVRARDWWPDSTQWRVTSTPQAPDGVERAHVLRDAEIQGRSFSIELPVLPPGAHTIDVDLRVERRAGADDPWGEVSDHTVPIRLRVDGELRLAVAPIEDADLTERMRRVFAQGLVQYASGGSLPVRVGMRAEPTFSEAFDDVAIAARVDVVRNGVIGRQLEIWWMGGTWVEDRQYAWEVPMWDDDVLGAPLSDDDEWVLHVRSVPELALRIKGAKQCWSGAFSIPVQVNVRSRSAPARGWLPVDAVSGGPPVRDDEELMP